MSCCSLRLARSVLAGSGWYLLSSVQLRERAGLGIPFARGAEHQHSLDCRCRGGLERLLVADDAVVAFAKQAAAARAAQSRSATLSSLRTQACDVSVRALVARSCGHDRPDSIETLTRSRPAAHAELSPLV